MAQAKGDKMSAVIRDAIWRTILAGVFLWFWQDGRGDKFECRFYGKDLNHRDMEKLGKCVVVSIQIEEV